MPTFLIVAELAELICYPTPSSDSQVTLLISGSGGDWSTGSVFGIIRYFGLLFNTLYLGKKKNQTNQYGKTRWSVNINQGWEIPVLHPHLTVLLGFSSKFILHVHMHQKRLNQTVLLRSTAEFQQPSKQECYPRGTHLLPALCKNAGEPAEEKNHRLSNASASTTNCPVNFDYKPKDIPLLWGVISVVFLYVLLVPSSEEKGLLGARSAKQGYGYQAHKVMKQHVALLSLCADSTLNLIPQNDIGRHSVSIKTVIWMRYCNMRATKFCIIKSAFLGICAHVSSEPHFSISLLKQLIRRIAWKSKAQLETETMFVQLDF